MNKTYNVQNIFKWYAQFNNTDIKITGYTKVFELNINNRSLPHLLGLQYTNGVSINLRGINLYNYIKNNNFSDEEIYDLVSKNSGESKLNEVANRINTFKEFMENLENAYIYENTNKYTKIKSNYLIVQTKEHNFLQLGIVKNDIDDLLVDFEVNEAMKDYIETYFTRKDDNYIKNSKVIEKVKSIEKYDEVGDLVPFSFKQVGLEDIYERIENEYNFDDSEATIDFIDIGQGTTILLLAKRVIPFILKIMKEKRL